MMYHLNQCKVNYHRGMMADYSWNWKEFRPKAGQADKRDRDGMLLKAVRFVKRNFNDLYFYLYRSVFHNHKYFGQLVSRLVLFVCLSDGIVGLGWTGSLSIALFKFDC